MITDHILQLLSAALLGPAYFCFLLPFMGDEKQGVSWSARNDETVTPDEELPTSPLGIDRNSKEFVNRNVQFFIQEEQLENKPQEPTCCYASSRTPQPVLLKATDKRQLNLSEENQNKYSQATQESTGLEPALNKVESNTEGQKLMKLFADLNNVLSEDGIQHQEDAVLLSLARQNRIPILIKYLENGTYDINAYDSKQRTTLHYAIMNRMPSALFERLLRHKDLDINQCGPIKVTALHYAAMYSLDPTILRMLLKTDHLDMNAKDVYGRTPLHYAVEWNNLDMVNRLLRLANPIIEDNNGLTPLQLAFRRDSPEMLSLLLQNEDVQRSLQHPKYDNLLHFSLRWCSPSSTMRLIDELLSNQSTKQHLAQMLLKRDRQGDTALGFAQKYLNHQLVSKLEETEEYVLSKKHLNVNNAT